MTDQAAPTQGPPSSGQPATPASQESRPAWTPPPPNTDLMAEIQKGYTAPPDKKG